MEEEMIYLFITSFLLSLMIFLITCKLIQLNDIIIIMEDDIRRIIGENK